MFSCIGNLENTVFLLHSPGFFIESSARLRYNEEAFQPAALAQLVEQLIRNE